MPRKTAKSYRTRLSATKHTANLITVRTPVVIEASSQDGGRPPTFKAVAYSGKPVPGGTATPTLDLPYVIDLAGVSVSRNVIANLDHKRDRRVGHVNEHANNGRQLEVSGVLSADTPEQQQVLNSSLRGFPWEVSSEFGMFRPRKLAAGKSETVNGELVKGPMYIFTKSTFNGLAFVSQGADDGNTVTIAATAAGDKTTMNEFEKFAAELGIDLDHATEEQKTRLQAIYDAEHSGDDEKPPKKGAKKDRVNFQAVAELERRENARQEEIKQMGLSAMKEHPMYIDEIENMATLAIDELAEPYTFELELLRRLKTKTGTFSTRMQSQSDPSVIEAAIAISVGLPEIEKHYSEQTLSAVDKVGLRNFSLQGLLMQIAHANGYSCRPGEHINIGNIRSVLEHCFPSVHARMSGFSTINLPGILGNIANKEILAGYMEEDQTWTEVGTAKTVNNFHAHSSYRMLDDLEYEEVGPGGQIKHGTLAQESYTRQAKTYAKMLGITRQDIINDDLGAFDDIRERLGRGAAKKFNNIFWAAFLANSSFFTTARTNYIEGATTNLLGDGVGLQQGITAYRKMKSPAADGLKRVGVSAGRPSILLIPPELEFIARALYVSENINTGGAATSASIPNANIHRNLFRPVIQDRLSDSAFSGYSATAWYLLGTNLKPMAASFLNGNRTPTVESTQADFDQLGIQFRGYHDFGCDQSEYLSGVKSKGAA